VPEAVIVSTARSPFGRAFKGSLKDLRPDDLAATVIQAALDKVPALDPHLVEDLYLGCAEPSGRHGSNMAKVVATLLGLDNTPAATINRFCASSAQTTRMAFHAIKAGEGDIFVSAGVECVSQYTDWAGAGGAKEDQQNGRFAEAQARTKRIAESNETWTDPRDDGALPDIYIAMGQTAENVATAYGIGRDRQDEWGVTSQNRAEAAIARGFFDWEITPVTTPDGTVVSADDGPRAGVTLEAVQGLKPVFRQEGTVTAGNCCPLNDGAAALVIMSDTKAKELGLEPLARVVSTAATGLSPEIMGLGPIEASRLALARAGMSIGDMDLYEINEAFAAQVIGSADQLGMDYDKLNVNGGAIAIGHPFGATGARIAGTIINALRDRDEQFGLETMCVGGGQGMAVIFERLS
jgi:acetyl-CoA C-acetyltransferase